MKERLLSRWTVTRVLYLLIGIVVISNSIMAQQWLGIVFGGYFSAMGLFAIGCASGNCYGGECEIETTPYSAKPNLPEQQ